MNGPNKTLRFVALALGYGFLYVPIFCLVAFSFNQSAVLARVISRESAGASSPMWATSMSLKPSHAATSESSVASASAT